MFSNSQPSTSAHPPLSLAVRETSTTSLLHVVSGIHAGVRIPVDGASCTIGSARACDLILADETVAADHVRLRFYGKTVAIDAIGGDVAVTGRPPIRVGHGCKASLPVEIGLGSARIAIAGPGLSFPFIRRLPLWIGGLATLVLVPIVAVQAGMLGGLSQSAVARPLDPVTTASIEGPAAAGRVEGVAAAAPTEAEVAARLEAKLVEADLGALRVRQGGRHIEVSGDVAPGGRSAWNEIQRWFDRTHGGRYVLTSLVGASAVAKAPQFDFQAVWFGADPYVIDADGERRYVGASLEGGWAIKSIDGGRILLVRSGEEFALTL